MAEVILCRHTSARGDLTVAFEHGAPLRRGSYGSTQRDFILRELEQSRLRQGWGWKREYALRLLAPKARSKKLSDEEARVLRNRRLLDTVPDGLKKGDVVVIPNLPSKAAGSSRG